jgi:hypothetical protein
MSKFILVLAFVTLTATAAEVRELGRVRITDAPDYWDSALYGDRPGLSFDGELRVTGSPVTRIEYDGYVSWPDGSRYEISDDADTLWWSQNGAEYRVWSRYDDSEYSVIFLRRAPDLQVVEIDGEEHVVPNYDRATILRIEKDGVVWDLDYRSADE